MLKFITTCALILLALPLSSNLTRADSAFFSAPSESPWLFQTLAASNSPSPPREYFSLNTIYLDGRIQIQLGQDLINQTYVIFPSPNVISSEALPNGKNRLRFQQYFPELDKTLAKTYHIASDKIRNLYLSSYEVYSQNGQQMSQIVIPPGVQYLPPQFFELEVEKGAQFLSFVYGFSGRSGWADSGVSSDLQGLYRDLRSIEIDRDSSIQLEIQPGSGFKAMEAYTDAENVQITRVLSQFQFMMAWGKMAEKDEILQQILKLKKFDEIQIDLTKGADELKKYPEIFGDDPKLRSVIKKITSEKLTEKDLNTSGSVEAKLGLGKFFSFGGSGSKKRDSRFKEMIKFEADGEFYVPRSLHFVLRTRNSFDLVNHLVLQAYNKLEEVTFKLGVGVSLLPSEKPTVRAVERALTPLSVSNASFQTDCDTIGVTGGVFSGVRSETGGPNRDRRYQFECQKFSLKQGSHLSKISSTPNPDGANLLQSAGTLSCKQDAFFTAIHSSFSQNPLSRKHSFQCSELFSESGIQLKKRACHWSKTLNRAFAQVDFSCPAGEAFAGIRQGAPQFSFDLELFELMRHKHRKPAPAQPPAIPVLADSGFSFECCEVSVD